MLSFNNLSLRRGSNLLFEDVSFTVHRNNKVGLVGANGTGKTSLFKMILGEFESDQGQCNYCLLYTSPSPRDRTRSRMPSSA